MHFCNFQMTIYDDGVIKYFCNGCEKGFFEKNKLFCEIYSQYTAIT